MKRILIPTDFSDNAKSAVDYALQLFNNENCTFYLLHSTFFTNPESRTHITAHYVEKLKKEGLGQLERLEQQLIAENENAKHGFKSIASSKRLSIAVDEAVKNNAIDYIVMGTKGTTDSAEYFAGSNTVEIVKRIKSCPVLVIPDKHRFTVPKKIGFPTDFSRFYDNRELEPLKSMAQLYNSEIWVLHINPKGVLTDIQEYNKELLHGHLSGFDHRFRFLNEDTKKTKGIERFIEEFGISLLIMVNYRHSLIENLIKEPVIKKLVFHPKIPILVIPE